MNADDAFPGKYLKASDLQGRRARVEISNVEFGKVGNDRKIILTFRGKEKQMVVNKTNMNTLVALTRTKETDDWVGWMVTLYAGRAEYQGKSVDALRISDDPASAVPPPRQQRQGHDRERERFANGREPRQSPPPPEPTEYESAPPDDREYRNERDRVYSDDIPF